MRKLRQFAIYRTPRGLRPVYAVEDGDGYLLYDAEYGARLPPRFMAQPDGSLTDWHGRRPGWTVDDLTDTGEDHHAAGR